MAFQYSVPEIAKKNDHIWQYTVYDGLKSFVKERSYFHTTTLWRDFYKKNIFDKCLDSIKDAELSCEMK